jgi:hypothetical protein
VPTSSFAKRARKYLLGLTTITKTWRTFIDRGRKRLLPTPVTNNFKTINRRVEKIIETFYLTGGEKHFYFRSASVRFFFAGHNHVGFKVIASEEERSIIE